MHHSPLVFGTTTIPAHQSVGCVTLSITPKLSILCSSSGLSAVVEQLLSEWRQVNGFVKKKRTLSQVLAVVSTAWETRRTTSNLTSFGLSEEQARCYATVKEPSIGSYLGET